MSRETGRTIAIVGSGASGKGVLHHLAAYYEKQDIKCIVIIDPLGVESGGEGHNAPDHSAQLNDTVERMGLDNRDPHHFARYAQTHDPRAFLSRKFYRSYLVDTFGEGLELIENAGIEIDVRETTASALQVDRRTGRATLLLEDGSPSVTLDSLQDLTLAPGHLPRKTTQQIADKFVPYIPRATSAAEKDDDFDNPDSVTVCVGGGLAFVDAFNALRNHNYQGKIIVFSPSGKIPPPRDVDADWGEFQPQLIPSTVPLNASASKLNDLVQAEIRRVMAETHLSEREIVGGLGVQSLCNRLDLEQRKIFYRTYGRHYLAAITPIPPDVHQVLQQAIAEGRVEIRPERLDVNTLQHAEGGIFIPGADILAGRVVDCRGYATLDQDDYDNSLLNQLIKDGIIVVNPDGGVAHVQNVTVGRDGRLGPCIVGPLTLTAQQCYGIETFRSGYDRVAGYLASNQAELAIQNRIRDLALADILTVIEGQKAIGCLPRSTIEKIIGQQPVEKWVRNYDDRGCGFLMRPERREYVEALFVYHPEKLQAVIDHHHHSLKERNFPVEPLEFVKKVMLSWENDPVLRKIISGAFADDTYNGEVEPLAHPSSADASVRGFNSASLGEVLAACAIGINPFEFMHPATAGQVIYTLRQSGLDAIVDNSNNKWTNHNRYILGPRWRDHFDTAAQELRTAPFQSASLQPRYSLHNCCREESGNEAILNL